MSWLVLVPLALVTLFAAVTTRLVRRIEAAVAALEQAMTSLPAIGEQSRRLRDQIDLTRRALDRHPNP